MTLHDSSQREPIVQARSRDAPADSQQIQHAVSVLSGRARRRARDLRFDDSGSEISGALFVFVGSSQCTRSLEGSLFGAEFNWARP